MKKSSRIAATLILLSAALPALAEVETFKLDKSRSLVGFRIRHFVSQVESMVGGDYFDFLPLNRFKDFDGTIWIDKQKPANSKVDLTIQVASVDTSSEARDDALRSETFFDVATFPTITFKSTKIEPKGKNTYDVTGEFTMHGVTKTITVTVKHGGFLQTRRRDGIGEKTSFEVAFSLNRQEFGINWNRPLDQGGFMLSDEVQISIQIEANKLTTEPSRPVSPGNPVSPSAPATSGKS